MTAVNSTFTLNIAKHYGGGGSTSEGGGIYSAGTLTISHSTVSDNYCQYVSGGVANDRGGGIWLSGVVHMSHTIVANNHALSGGRDLYGALATSGYNLIGKSAGGSGYVPSDLLDVDPDLGPLQDNGGPTQTMALLPGSPAIDAGDPNPADPPEWDQRGPGFPRIVNGRIDIGAFEVQATGAPSSNNLLAILITADL
jgi:hypothetical protein